MNRVELRLSNLLLCSTRQYQSRRWRVPDLCLVRDSGVVLYTNLVTFCFYIILSPRPLLMFPCAILLIGRQDRRIKGEGRPWK